jgi:AraC family transcriptional activator of pobA
MPSPKATAPVSPWRCRGCSARRGGWPCRNAQALLHARLVREASRRLVRIAAPVSTIAFELGFSDPAYFCRFFKRHTGSAPRDYRARLGAAGAPGGAR